MARHPLIAYVLPRCRRLGGGILLRAQGRDRFLESIAVVAIIGMLTTLATGAYTGIGARIALYDVASLDRAYRLEAAVSLATTGELPATIVTGETGKQGIGRVIDRVDWRDGEIVFALRTDIPAGRAGPDGAAAGLPLELSVRAARNAAGTRLFFLCGFAEPPPGFTAAPAVHTTVPPHRLPGFCRA